MSILTKNFPDFLESEEVDRLIEQCRQGNLGAKEKIVLHNLKSVSWAVNSQFKNIKHDKEDLFSIGVIGLMKAIEKYNPEYGGFKTFSCRCIINEILMELRKRRSVYEKTKDSVVLFKEKEALDLLDMIADENDGMQSKESSILVRELLECVSEKQKDSLMKYYGIDCEEMGQTEIAKLENMNQATISRRIIVGLKKMREILKDDEIKMV